MRDFDVVHHAAAHECDLATYFEPDIDYLLNPMNGRRKARQDDTTRRRARQFFDARYHGAFGRCVAGALDVGGITEERKNPFVAVARERVNVEASAFDWRVVNLEVACMDNDSEGRANGERDTIHRA